MSKSTVWRGDLLYALAAAPKGREDEAAKMCGFSRRPAVSHYEWLERNLPRFFSDLHVSCHASGIIHAHGDKCYGYRSRWNEVDIPFEHGVAIYLLSYIYPWSEGVRDTKTGWVDPVDWVVARYQELKHLLPAV